MDTAVHSHSTFRMYLFSTRLLTKNQRRSKSKRRKCTISSSEHTALTAKQMVMTQRYRLKPSQTLQWPAATHWCRNQRVCCALKSTYMLNVEGHLTMSSKGMLGGGRKTRKWGSSKVNQWSGLFRHSVVRKCNISEIFFCAFLSSLISSMFYSICRHYCFG